MMANIEYGSNICAKCEKDIKNHEAFHVIINKGVPDTDLSFDDIAGYHGWTAEMTYYKENVSAMLCLCEECKNKLLNFICYKEDENE